MLTKLQQAFLKTHDEDQTTKDSEHCQNFLYTAKSHSVLCTVHCSLPEAQMKQIKETQHRFPVEEVGAGDIMEPSEK